MTLSLPFMVHFGARNMGRPIRILLADDHPALRKSLARVLEREESLEVVGEASDGRMAVDLARELRPDVIVMDVQMPGLDGIEATRRIALAQPGTRVIGYSLNPSGSIAEAMRRAGAASCLGKNEPVAALIRVIRAFRPREV